MRTLEVLMQLSAGTEQLFLDERLNVTGQIACALKIAGERDVGEFASGVRQLDMDQPPVLYAALAVNECASFELIQ